MSFDPLPSIDVPELELYGQFYTSASPVSAEGTICGRNFYFWAKYEGWEFAVSESPDIDPCLSLFDDVRKHLFIREGRYGDGKFAASYMPLDVAAQFIESSAREYVQRRPPSRFR